DKVEEILETVKSIEAHLQTSPSPPRQTETLVWCPLSPFNYFVQALARTFYLRQDFLSRCFPDVALGCQVAFGQITEDRLFEFLHAAEAARQHNVLAQVAEKSLYQIQPRAARRGEVQMKARMSLQPAFDLRRLVGGVIVQDQMNL